MIVIDTNIIAYAMIEGERTLLAHQTLQRGLEWRVPELWRHEFLNVLATYVLSGGASKEEGLRIWKQALGVFLPSESPVDMATGLKIAVDFKISAYDAQFVCLAKLLGVNLVTEDKLLLKNFPDFAVTMQSFCRL